jgi:hypothetical protein
LLITDRVRFVTDNRKLIPAYQVSIHPGVWVSAVTLHIKAGTVLDANTELDGKEGMTNPVANLGQGHPTDEAIPGVAYA